MQISLIAAVLYVGTSAAFFGAAAQKKKANRALTTQIAGCDCPE